MKTVETTATEVFLHAADHGDKPVIHGAELDYDDVHDGVHYHADLIAPAKAARESAFRAHQWAAECLAITVDLAETDGRSPRDWSTYDTDLAKYRKARTDYHAAHDHLKALYAKRDQDAAFKTYEVSA